MRVAQSLSPTGEPWEMLSRVVASGYRDAASRHQLANATAVLGGLVVTLKADIGESELEALQRPRSQEPDRPWPVVVRQALAQLGRQAPWLPQALEGDLELSVASHGPALRLQATGHFSELQAAVWQSGSCDLFLTADWDPSGVTGSFRLSGNHLAAGAELIETAPWSRDLHADRLALTGSIAWPFPAQPQVRGHLRIAQLTGGGAKLDTLGASFSGSALQPRLNFLLANFPDVLSGSLWGTADATSFNLDGSAETLFTAPQPTSESDDAAANAESIEAPTKIVAGTERAAWQTAANWNLSVDGWLHLPTWLAETPWGQNPRLAALQHLGQGRLTAAADLQRSADGTFSIGGLYGRLLLPGFNDPPLHADWLTTGFQFHDQHLTVGPAVLEAPGWSLRGEYQQNLANGDYRVLGSGLIDPPSVAHYLDPVWWADFWSQFSPRLDLPKVDFDLQGRFFSGRAHRWLFTKGDLTRTTYRGVPFDAITTKVLMQPTSLDLFDTEAWQHPKSPLPPERPGSTATTPLPAVSASPLPRYLNLRLSSKTTLPDELRQHLAASGQLRLPLPEISLLLDDQVRSFAPFFDSKTTVESAFSSLTYGPASQTPGETYLQAAVTALEPWNFARATLDQASFELTLSPERLAVRQLKATLGGGLLTGLLDLENPFAPEQPDPASTALTPASTKLLRAHFNLTDARHEAIVALFNPTEATSQPPTPIQTPSAKPLRPAFHSGLVSLEGSIAGPLDALVAATGRGTVQFREARLGPVMILNGLHRFNLDEGQSSWELNQGILSLPDITLSNEASVITAQGSLNLVNNSVNLRAIIAPFGSVRVPLIGLLLNTVGRITQVIEARATGTVNDLNWTFTLQPLGVFAPPSGSR